MYSVDGLETEPLRRKGRRASGTIKGAALRALKALGRHAPMAGAFFLLSLARCFALPSPYALCCLTALLGAGERPYAAWAGLALGFCFRLAWGLDADAWQFIACFLCIPLLFMISPGKAGNWLLTGALLLVRAAPGMVTAGDAQTVILHGAGVLLGLASMPALNRAARIWKARTWQMGQDDVVCLTLPLLLMVGGASRLSAFGVNLGYAWAAWMVLLLSWISGGAAGVCGGMGCGLALLLGGQSALLMVKLALGALLAGFFQGRNRLLAAGMYLLSGVTVSYTVSGGIHAPLFFAEGAACLLVCLIPGKGVRKIGWFVRRVRWSQPRENAYTRLRMQHWVRAIDCMADALPRPRMEEPGQEEACEELMEKLCQGCDRLPICWHERQEETKAAMQALAERREEDALDVINRHFSACVRIGKIPDLLRRLEEERLRRAQRAICADYERDMLQTHLTALSQAAQRISLEGMNADGEEAYWMTQAEEGLQALRFPGQTAFVKRVEGHIIVCLKCDPLSLRPAAGDMLARQLSVRLGADLIVTEQQGGRILLEEEPPLDVKIGMATASAVTRDRMKRRDRQPGDRPDNGDAVLVRFLQGGRQLLALSDGMGHGAGAQDESKKTLEMLSLCLEAGYTRSQAMTAVNGAMLSATGGEKFATVDLCLIDLWTGETEMNKLGACESYVVQGQKIQAVEGAALPLGIIEHVTPMEHRVRLGEGDVLVLLSDGISDSFAEEEEILAVLRRCRGDSPQRLADALLREAMIQQDGMPPDDMTVLCARVTDRKKEYAAMQKRGA